MTSPPKTSPYEPTSVSGTNSNAVEDVTNPERGVLAWFYNRILIKVPKDVTQKYRRRDAEQIGVEDWAPYGLEFDVLQQLLAIPKRSNN